MANKLAGQRAKFSRARALYYSSPEEDQRVRAVQLMAEVIADAPHFGFTEDEVTQSEDVPDEVRRAGALQGGGRIAEELSDSEEAGLLRRIVDASAVREFGAGEESVYAYGYACAPDRLKIGSARGDALARIAAQISTGTPDRPVLRVVVRTHDCRALERALHNILRLRGRRVEGAGAEWFIASADEVVSLVETIIECAPQRAAGAAHSAGGESGVESA